MHVLRIHFGDNLQTFEFIFAECWNNNWKRARPTNPMDEIEFLLVLCVIVFIMTVVFTRCQQISTPLFYFSIFHFSFFFTFYATFAFWWMFWLNTFSFRHAKFYGALTSSLETQKWVLFLSRSHAPSLNRWNHVKFHRVNFIPSTILWIAQWILVKLTVFDMHAICHIGGIWKAFTPIQNACDVHWIVFPFFRCHSCHVQSVHIYFSYILLYELCNRSQFYILFYF